MPIGVIINSFVIIAGGIMGGIAGQKLSQNFKDKLSMVFGVCSMGIGISSIVLMQNIPAVIFAVIIGTAIGLTIHLGDRINALGRGMQKAVSRFVAIPAGNGSPEEVTATLVTVIVLFSATGFRMINVKMFPTADMIPAMIIAIPVSRL